MKPMKFAESNKVLTKPKGMTDKECGPLHVYSDGKHCISLWKLTFAERVKGLLFGNLWLYIWSGETQPPVAIVIKKTVFN